MPLLCLHCCEQPVEVVQVGYISLNSRNPGAENRYRLIQLVLTPPRDEDVCALGYKPLRRRQADAAIAASDHCNLSCEPSHISDLSYSMKHQLRTAACDPNAFALWAWRRFPRSL